MIYAVELFAGIGGFRLASDELGIKTIWANDINDNAAKIYQQYGGSFVQGDIRNLRHLIPNHHLLTAGLPCQPFSSAGKKKGINDPRGTLFEVVAQIIKTHSPLFFVLENVKRLLSMDKGQHFATILNSLSSLGYLIECSLRQVPQLTRMTLWQGGAVNFEKDSDRPRMYIERDKRFENDLDKTAELILKDVFQSRQYAYQIVERYINPINEAFSRIFGEDNGTQLTLLELIPPLEDKVANILFKKGDFEIHYNYLGNGRKFSTF